MVRACLTARLLSALLCPSLLRKKEGHKIFNKQLKRAGSQVVSVTSVTPSVKLSASPVTHVTQVASSGSSESDFSVECQVLALHQQTPVGGRQRFLLRKWRALGASRIVSRRLRRGYHLPFPLLGEVQLTCPPSLVVSYANPDNMHALNNLVGTLLNKHVIEPVPMQEECLHNIVFLCPKPNGT